jgi:Alcohol dehydrogenase GroES-like domain
METTRTQASAPVRRRLDLHSRQDRRAPARAVPGRVIPCGPQDPSTDTSKEAAMRAITVSAYGASPSVTKLATPQAGPGQVLIAIQAAGMNPMDAQIANGGWQDRVPRTFPMVLGADLAGTVREDGPGVARFAPGVFGQLLIPPLGSTGTYAQYVACGQDAPADYRRDLLADRADQPRVPARPVDQRSPCRSPRARTARRP